MVNIISEIGINHNGDINLCKQLIMLSKVAGADYVKIQKRKPDVCVPPPPIAYFAAFVSLTSVHADPFQDSVNA